ncbi:hypothetical protein ACFLU6_12075, partial [Acidobacteriota bacterium]
QAYLKSMGELMASNGKATEMEKLILHNEVTRFLRAWKKDWENKDLDGYISHYAQNFRSGSGQNLRAWKARKAKIFGQAEWIDVSIENLKSERNNAAVSIYFHQIYKSDRLQDKGIKKISLEWNGNTWKILSEDWHALP